MLAQWTADIVGKMHLHGITAIELSHSLDMNPKYVSTVLNGKRTPKGAEAKFSIALDEIIAEHSK